MQHQTKAALADQQIDELGLTIARQKVQIDSLQRQLCSQQSTSEHELKDRQKNIDLLKAEVKQLASKCQEAESAADSNLVGPYISLTLLKRYQLWAQDSALHRKHLPDLLSTVCSLAKLLSPARHLTTFPSQNKPNDINMDGPNYFTRNYECSQDTV